VKTFGRFSSHRRSEHQKNISGRGPFPRMIPCRAVASGASWVHLNLQRALMGKGRNAGEGAAHHGESSTGLSKSSAQNGAKKSAVKEAKPKDVTPIFDFSVSASEFQPFPYRPSGNGSGEKLQALLSQREVMLQLPLHSQLKILRWACACKVPRIFPPSFDQA